MKKPSKKQSSLTMAQIISQIDNRNYDFYNSLDEKTKKEISPYVLMRFMSNAEGDSDIQEWFLERTNEFINKNHWTLSKEHKGLLWKLYAALGAGMPVQHPYLPVQKIELNKIEILLGEIHPTMKLEDIKFLASMMTDDDKEELFEKMGFDKEERKKYI